MQHDAFSDDSTYSQDVVAFIDTAYAARSN